MARTKKNYGGVDYIADENFDYTTAIQEAAAHGDYEYASSLEKSRNAKIDGEGLSYAKTYKYQNGTPALYKSENTGKIGRILSGILNREPFDYDYTKDDSYKALEKAYKDNGRFAMQDTLGDAAALTGGKASTAATSAALQAYNRYMVGLSENIPALEQAAYGRYRDEEESAYRAADALMAIDERDYGRWQDSWNRDYMINRDTILDKRYDNEWNYGVERDKVADERYNDEVGYDRDVDTVSRLMDIANETGDYSILLDNPEIAKKFGFTEATVAALNKAYAEGISDKKIAEAFSKAQYMAQYGDFSAFRDAGFTDEQINAMQEYWKRGELREDALLAAQFGDYSKLSELGITLPGAYGSAAIPANSGTASGAETVNPELVEPAPSATTTGTTTRAGSLPANSGGVTTSDLYALFDEPPRDENGNIISSGMSGGVKADDLYPWDWGDNTEDGSGSAGDGNTGNGGGNTGNGGGNTVSEKTGSGSVRGEFYENDPYMSSHREFDEDDSYWAALIGYYKGENDGSDLPLKENIMAVLDAAYEKGGFEAVEAALEEGLAAGVFDRGVYIEMRNHYDVKRQKDDGRQTGE